MSLQRVFITLRRIEDWLLVTSLLFMLILAAGQIILRNLFDVGVIWSEPVLKLLVLWATLLGAMVATRERNHINIDLLSRFLGPRLKPLLSYFVAWFSALVLLLIAFESVRFVIFEYQDGTRFFGNFPSWIVELILPIGFTSIGLRFLVQPLVAPLKAPENEQA